MLSLRAKKNICLVMAILSIGIIVDRTIRLIDGSIEWTSLVSGIAIFLLLSKSYLCFRKKMREEGLE